MSSPAPTPRQRTSRQRAVRLARPQDVTARAAVVDVWPLVRAGIVVVLEELGIESTWQVGGVQDALRSVQDPIGQPPDLVVLGSCADLPLLEAVRTIRQGWAASSALIVLLDRTDGAELRALLTAAVDGILMRTVGQRELRAAVVQVLDGSRVVAGTPLAVLAGADLTPEPVAPADPGLTNQERRVLSQLALQRTNRQIASALHVSEATVKTHLSHLYVKLGVAGRHGAVVAAVERGLLT